MPARSPLVPGTAVRQEEHSPRGDPWAILATGTTLARRTGAIHMPILGNRATPRPADSSHSRLAPVGAGHMVSPASPWAMGRPGMGTWGGKAGGLLRAGSPIPARSRSHARRRRSPAGALAPRRSMCHLGDRGGARRTDRGHRKLHCYSPSGAMSPTPPWAVRQSENGAESVALPRTRPSPNHGYRPEPRGHDPRAARRQLDGNVRALHASAG